MVLAGPLSLDVAGMLVVSELPVLPVVSLVPEVASFAGRSWLPPQATLAAAIASTAVIAKWVMGSPVVGVRSRSPFVQSACPSGAFELSEQLSRFLLAITELTRSERRKRLACFSGAPEPQQAQRAIVPRFRGKAPIGRETQVLLPR
jgi:hypothetical protein